jgi:hypothetical protein
MKKKVAGLQAGNPSPSKAIEECIRVKCTACEQNITVCIFYFIRIKKDLIFVLSKRSERKVGMNYRPFDTLILQHTITNICHHEKEVVDLSVGNLSP